MKTVTIHEAKTHLSKLIRAVTSGEFIIIAKGKTPLVELRPFSKPTGKRKIGDYTGKISMTSDFDKPLKDFKEYMK